MVVRVRPTQTRAKFSRQETSWIKLTLLLCQNCRLALQGAIGITALTRPVAVESSEAKIASLLHDHWKPVLHDFALDGKTCNETLPSTLRIKSR